MKNGNTYKTKDFYLASALLAHGTPLQKLENITGSIFNFVFGISEKNAEEVLQSYWDRSLKLPVRNFVEAINELKTRIHLGS